MMDNDKPEVLTDDTLDGATGGIISGGQAGAMLGGAIGGQLRQDADSGTEPKDTALD